MTTTQKLQSGTRVVMTSRWPAGTWYGTVTKDLLQPGDTRVPVKIDSGATILYDRSEVTPV